MSVIVKVETNFPHIWAQLEEAGFKLCEEDHGVPHVGTLRVYKLVDEEMPVILGGGKGRTPPDEPV